MPTIAEIEEAFWANVWRCAHRKPCNKCCWPWKRFDYSVNTERIWAKHALFTCHALAPKSTIPAHRFALELSRGTLLFQGQDFHVCHQCDFAPCCNPLHVAMGSRSDNLRGSHGHKHRRKPVQLPNGNIWLYEDAVRHHLHHWAQQHGYMPDFAYRRAHNLGIALSA